MKKAIVLAVIFLIIIASGVCEHFYVHKVFDEFNVSLNEIETLVENDDIKTAEDETVDLQSWWKEKKHTLEMITYCADIRQVNVVIGEIQGSLERDDTENASSKIDSLYELIDNIRDILDFNAADII